MENLTVQVAAFEQRCDASHMRPAPRQLTEAGLFFLGFRDHVKSWYCNICLEHWEYTDAPWVENSKWKPSCEFLL